MPSDGPSDWEPTTDPRPATLGRTVAPPAQRGPRVPVRQRAFGAELTVESEPTVEDAYEETRLNPYAIPSVGRPPRTGPPRQGPPGPRTLPPPDRPVRTGSPPTAGAPAIAPPVAPPPDGPQQRRPRWWLALVAVLAVALGATAAVLADRGMRDTQVRPPGGDTGAGASPQGADQPSAGPSGREGLGPGSTVGPSGAPTTPDPAPFFPGNRKTLPGSSISLQGGESFSDALARADRTIGPLRSVRVFYPGLPPAWGGSRTDQVNRTVIVSFKAHPRDINSGKYDSRLAAWFASVPRQYDVFWAYWHEPENDVERGAFKPADFRAAWRRVAGLANRAGNPRLVNTVILMCFTVAQGSRRDFNDYYPGSDLVETLGWDCYSHAPKTGKYLPAENIYGKAIAKSRSLGKPWGIAETGSTKIKGDAGSGRAAWIRSISTYLNDQRPLWVTYFNQSLGGGDFRLTDTPSMQAWKAWCSAAV
jgi:hypothetical protein